MTGGNKPTYLCLQRSSKHMGVSKNSGFYTPKSSILIGFSIISHPFWETPIFGNTNNLQMQFFVFFSLRKGKNRLFWSRVAVAVFIRLHLPLCLPRLSNSVGMIDKLIIKMLLLLYYYPRKSVQVQAIHTYWRSSMDVASEARVRKKRGPLVLGIMQKVDDEMDEKNPTAIQKISLH